MEPPFQCKYCDKQFNSKNNVRRHTKTVHKRNSNGDIILDKPRESFNCELCDKKLACKKTLTKHINIQHLTDPNLKKYSCSKCTFKTVYQSNLKRHILNTHEKIEASGQASVSEKFMCSKCTATFKQKNCLKYHEQTIHGMGEMTVIKRNCPMCPYVSKERSKGDIHIHFKKIHNIPVTKRFYKFYSVEGFYSWKNKIEIETTTSYIKTKSTVTCTYFQCHRCGYHKSKGHTKRALKQSGSCKINGYCPASMRMRLTDNEVSVVYTDTHVGHKNDPKYIRLSSEEKLSIALQLANKKPHRDILKSIKGSVSNNDLHRIHLTNKKDIINIKNSFNLNDEAVKHPLDPISIDSLVEELSNSDSMVLFIYKPQGVDFAEFLELRKEDFLLIFMTEVQKIFLQKYSNDSIYIDSTQGLSSCDFQLYTLLTLDETREGFPAAFMFTNRGDEYIISKFFESIKTTAGSITPKVFMSDMEERFFSAWEKIMGTPEQRIFCTWHVLKAWRTNITQKIKIKEKRDDVYKLLQTLLYELDIETFKKLISETMKTLDGDQDLVVFSKYFEKYYLRNERFKTWAYCFRIHAGINTNVSIENFNKVLKYCYLRGTKVHHLDETLCKILNLLSGKLFELLMKMKRGNLMRKLQILRKNHRQSLIIDNDQITKAEHMWQVHSSEKTELYTVKRVTTCKTCQLRCLHCNSCFHEFVCTCMDSNIRNNMCTHIHALAKTELKGLDYCTKHTSSNSGQEQRPLDCELIEEEVQEEILKHISNPVNQILTIDEEIFKINQECQTLKSRIIKAEQVDFVQNEMRRIMPALDAMNLPSTYMSTLEIDSVSLEDQNSVVMINTDPQIIAGEFEDFFGLDI